MKNSIDTIGNRTRGSPVAFRSGDKTVNIMHLLCNHGHFPRQWNGHRGPIQWPQLSDDTPCVLLLWAWAKQEAADRNHKKNWRAETTNSILFCHCSYWLLAAKF